MLYYLTDAPVMEGNILEINYILFTISHITLKHLQQTLGR